MRRISRGFGGDVLEGGKMVGIFLDWEDHGLRDPDTLVCFDPVE